VKYKTLFRLALKVMGVYFIALGLTELTWITSQVLEWVAPVYSMNLSNVNASNYRLHEAIRMLYPLIKLGVGLYLFFGGEWIVNKAIPSNRPYCHECGYMLKDLKGTRCPECDTPFRPEPPPPPPATS